MSAIGQPHALLICARSQFLPVRPHSRHLFKVHIPSDTYSYIRHQSLVCHDATPTLASAARVSPFSIHTFVHSRSVSKVSAQCFRPFQGGFHKVHQLHFLQPEFIHFDALLFLHHHSRVRNRGFLTEVKCLFRIESKRHAKVVIRAFYTNYLCSLHSPRSPHPLGSQI